MKDCPFCDGKSISPKRQVHFGEGIYKPEICSVCKGTGKVKIEQMMKNKITIIKFHGVWQDCKQTYA